MRTFTELSALTTIDERYKYLRIGGRVGDETFGWERTFNQQFYRSAEWKRARRIVIARDMEFDLGVKNFPVRGNSYIHHMNPIRPEDFDECPELLVDPEFLITTSFRTHNAIHYGSASLLPQDYVERRPGDTKLWQER